MLLTSILATVLVPSSAPAAAVSQSSSRVAEQPVKTSGALVRNDDVVRFWSAFDAINATTDQQKKLDIIRSQYIDPGSTALHALMKARCYTDREYVEAIAIYPRFWASIRPLTLRSREGVKTLNADVAALRRLYPELKPATITYAIGILRTGGTTVGNMVLIGAESGLANENVDASEFPEPQRTRLTSYFKSNPFKANAHTNLHEYVHTQQQETTGTLLQQALREGAAELIAELITQRRPALPHYAFGFENDTAVKRRFLADMNTSDYSNWLWNNAKNSFGVSDLGYYIGYRTAKSYYDASPDKKLAIKTLIELPYNDPVAVKAFVSRISYLSD